MQVKFEPDNICPDSPLAPRVTKSSLTGHQITDQLQTKLVFRPTTSSQTINHIPLFETSNIFVEIVNKHRLANSVCSICI